VSNLKIQSCYRNVIDSGQSILGVAPLSNDELRFTEICATRVTSEKITDETRKRWYSAGPTARSKIKNHPRTLGDIKGKKRLQNYGLQLNVPSKADRQNRNNTSHTRYV